MNCKKHPSEPAVAQCASCGSYVCAECAERTSEVRDTFGTLCIDCYKERIYEGIAYHEQRRDDSKKYAIISLVLFGAGVLTFIVGLVINLFCQNEWFGFDHTNLEGVFATVGGWILTGVFPAIQEWIQANKDQDEYESKYGATYQVNSDGSITKDRDIWTMVFRVAWKLMFGPILTIQMLLGFKEIINESNGYIEAFKEELDSL